MSRRILIVSNFFPPHTIGGAEIVAFRQARALAARGHQVTVLAGAQPSPGMTPGSTTFDVYEGLPVYRVAMRSLEPELNFYSPATARRLQAVIAGRNIEVVHFHNLAGLGANLIPAAKAAGTRVALTLHDHWGFCFRNTRLRPDSALCSNAEECCGCQPTIQPPGELALPMRLRRDYVAWCLNQADQWLTPSAYMASAYADAAFPSAPITVLSNGIDIDSIPFAPKLSPPSPAVKFLYSGYLGEHKGILVLLDALRQLLQDVNLSPRWQMTIAGDGHLRKTVETTLERYKLAENVHLIGRVSRAQLLQLLAQSDVAVLPSIWPENQPVSLLEAIASGTPQIATRTGGNAELVQHMGTGLLVKPGDAADLAEAMRRYILEPSLRTQHGTQSRQQRQQWDEARTIDILESILSAASPAPGSTPTVEPVIVCQGESAPPEAGLLINRAYQHLPGPAAPRFLWHRWAEPAVWRDAVAVWLWDRDGEESVFQAALRRGIPVLSPNTDWAQGLARHYGGVRIYHTFTEALAILRVLLARPALRAEFAERARASATAATFFASRQAFTLHSEAPVEPN